MKQKKSSFQQFIEGVLIIIGVVLLVALLWDILFGEKKKKQTDQERLDELLSLEKQYEQGITKSRNNEKWIYLTARTIIVLTIIALNTCFYFYFCLNLNWKETLNDLLNINEVLILCYSFIAFALYGTPSKFVKGIRVAIYRWRKKRNLPVDVNIDAIKSEIKQLKDKLNPRIL